MGIFDSVKSRLGFGDDGWEPEYEDSFGENDDESASGTSSRRPSRSSRNLYEYDDDSSEGRENSGGGYSSEYGQQSPYREIDRNAQASVRLVSRPGYGGYRDTADVPAEVARAEASFTSRSSGPVPAARRDYPSLSALNGGASSAERDRARGAYPVRDARDSGHEGVARFGATTGGKRFSNLIHAKHDEPIENEYEDVDDRDMESRASASRVRSSYDRVSDSSGFDPSSAYVEGYVPTAVASTPKQMHVAEPKSYSDIESIAKHFKAGEPVVVSLLGTRAEVAKRILDFSFGLTCAIDGNVQKIAEKVFLLTRDSAQLSDEDRARLRESGLVKGNF